MVERWGVRTALVIGAVALTELAAGAAPASASAPEVFIRYEENAQANWVVTEECADASQAQLFVSVIGGLEFESPDLTDVNDFVSLLVQGSRCDGTFVSERGNSAADYTGSPTLRRASVTGSISLNDGRVASIEVRWTGVGRLESDVNRTELPGFIGIFRNRQRDAEATGTVVLDGATLVSGPSESADIETLEDLNITF